MDVMTAVASPVEKSTEAQLESLKSVVRSLMRQASQTLTELEKTNRDPRFLQTISELDHCLDYTERLCCAGQVGPADPSYSTPRLWHRC